MPEDKILMSFLAEQEKEARTVTAESDLVSVHPVAGAPPNRYIAEFRCKGLVRNREGKVCEANGFGVGIWFPSHYLRKADTFEVLHWLGPLNAWHPNIKPPVVCVGRLKAGTPLAAILYQLFEIITYAKVTMREDNALNREACAWARSHVEQFPIDRRPLKRRALDLCVSVTDKAESP